MYPVFSAPLVEETIYSPNYLLDPVLVFLSMIKCPGKKQLREERFDFVHYSKVLSITAEKSGAPGAPCEFTAQSRAERNEHAFLLTCFLQLLL